MSGLWLLYGKGRTLGWIGIKHLHTHPPTWVSVLLGLGFISVVPMASGTSHAVAMLQALTWLLRGSSWVGWTGSLIVMAVMAMPSLYSARQSIYDFCSRRLLRESNKSKPASQAPTDEPPSSVDEILKWIQTDDEVTERRDDRFSHRLIADRIAKRLSDKDIEATVALIGPKGSGKSTIRNMVIDSLRTQSTVSIVPVSLWPFDSAEAAVKGILQAIIKEIGKHTTILSLTGLSDDYASAIERSAGFPGFGRLLRGNSAPDELVANISAACSATGIRVVLWIEDVERFTGAAESPDSSQHAKDYEKLGPVRALLHLFDKHPSISVVVADVSIRSGVDVYKLARYVEIIPSLDTSAIWRVFEPFRNECLKQGSPHFPGSSTFIDPASKHHRERLAWTNRHSEIRPLIGSPLIDKVIPLTIYLADLVETPRAMKAILRGTLEAWKSLYGEIDFDSLFTIKVIQATQPYAFALLSDRIDDIRASRSGTVDPDDSDRMEQNDKILYGIDDRARHALNALINYALPRFDRESFDNRLIVGNNPQGLWRFQDRDVWRSLNNLDIADPNTLDQTLLNSIVAWRQGEASTLISELSSPRLDFLFYIFADQFFRNDIVRLTKETTEDLLTKSTIDRDEYGDPQAFKSISTIASVFQFSDAKLLDLLTQLLDISVKKSLLIAHSLVERFQTFVIRSNADAARSERMILIDSLQHMVRMQCEHCGPKYIQLTLSPRDSDRLAKIAMLHLPHGVEPYATTPQKEWRPVSSAILGVISRDPAFGLRLVASFIFVSVRRPSVTISELGDSSKSVKIEYRLDETAIENWFGRVALLDALHLTSLTPADVGPEFEERCTAILEWAKKQRPSTSDSQ